MKSLQEQVMKTSNVSGNIFDIKRFATHDGHGIRTTVFLKGCPLKCVWCQNPEGIKLERQVLYFRNKCIKCGTCVKNAKCGGVEMKKNEIILHREIKEDWNQLIYLCPTNALQFDSKEYTLNEVMNEIKKDQVFYRDTGGVTLSGGEPFYQYEFLYEMLKQCKEGNIHTALETTLATSIEQLESVLPYLDQIYVDIKIMNNEQHKKYVGATNKHILENIKFLLSSEYRDKVIIRTPLIPNITTSHKNIERIVEFLVSIYPDVKYELLNYNPLAQAKYNYIDEEYCYKDNPKQYSQEKMNEFYDLVRENGIHNLVID